MAENTLYYGDNLDVLREHVKDESVDLIYLDPPFNSNADYSVFFKERDGTAAAAQITAFKDAWHWDQEAARAYEGVVEGGGKTSDAMRAFRKLLGTNDMLAYLTMMAPRLTELHRVLKKTGSIYLHCDATASAFLRILMDAVFGPANFRNELIWYYYNKMHDSRKKMFPQANDNILFYVKDAKSPFFFAQLKEMRDRPVKQLLRKKVAGKMVNAKDAQGHVLYRQKVDRTVDNVWRIPCLQPAASERLGYPTQKPVALLRRILEASSKPGDVILDPFCGCGTTIDAAEQVNRENRNRPPRRWVGIDITQAAIVVIKKRLRDSFGDACKYSVVGEPIDLEGAQDLAAETPYQFQWWALGLAGARPAASEEKKGTDKGIDGRLLFHDGPTGCDTKQVIFSVKAGRHIHANMVNELLGVLRQEEAQIGVLISMEPPAKPMRVAAASAGFYESPSWGTKYPRLQLLTVEDLLAGRKVDMPPTRDERTFSKARRFKPEQVPEQPLPLDYDPGE